MSRLRPLSFKEVRQILNDSGFLLEGSKGSHFKYKNRQGRTVIVPKRKEIAVGTIKSIMDQSGISRKQFTRQKRR